MDSNGMCRMTLQKTNDAYIWETETETETKRKGMKGELVNNEKFYNIKKLTCSGKMKYQPLDHPCRH